MKEAVKSLAIYRMERAKETFKEAVVLLEKGTLHGAVNRFYYASFYAARSLLATIELDSSKHSGVISLFQKSFVKTEKISADLSKALPRSFEQRQDSDYEDFAKLDIHEVEKIREQVSRFVSECEKLLNECIKA